MNIPKKLIFAPLFALLLSCTESSKDNSVQPEEEILFDKVSLTYEGQWNLIEGDLVPDNCNGVDSIANGKSYLSLWTIMRKEFSSSFSFAWKSHAMRQGSCRLNHAAKALLRVCAAMSSLSGLRATGPIGVQFRIPFVQRLGLVSLAFRYSA